MPDKASLFTCVTCNVAFATAELQREHYKSDWHRYNLKRRVAELDAVTLSDFNERAKLQQKQKEAATVPEPLYCKLTKKHFASANAMDNYLKSKKYLDIVKKQQQKQKRQQQNSGEKAEEAVVDENSKNLIPSDRAEKKLASMNKHLLELQQQAKEIADVAMDEEDEEDDEAGSWEEVDEDYDEDKEAEEKNMVPMLTCLFCDYKATSLEDKLEHMAKEHSFHIPAREHVHDMPGLIKHLGIKVGHYNVCLWCSSKCYRDLGAVRKHMADKGHQKMKFEGETLIEYVDFYSFEGMNDEDEEEDEKDNHGGMTDEEYDMLNESEMSKWSIMSLTNSTVGAESRIGSGMENNDYELVLPSGARIGHRSLIKYYRQSFGHRNLEKKQQVNHNMKDKYRAIVSGQCYSPAEIKKQRKDMAYFQRWSQKMKTHLGGKANLLRENLRRPDITFS